MATRKNKVSSEKRKPVKLSKSQVRRIAELRDLYKAVSKYALREEAYETVIKLYLQLKRSQSQ